MSLEIVNEINLKTDVDYWKIEDEKENFKQKEQDEYLKKNSENQLD